MIVVAKIKMSVIIIQIWFELAAISSHCITDMILSHRERRKIGKLWE